MCRRWKTDPLNGATDCHTAANFQSEFLYVNVWLKTLWTDSIGKEIVYGPQSVKLYLMYMLQENTIHSMCHTVSRAIHSKDDNYITTKS